LERSNCCWLRKDLERCRIFYFFLQLQQLTKYSWQRATTAYQSRRLHPPIPPKPHPWTKKNKNKDWGYAWVKLRNKIAGGRVSTTQLLLSTAIKSEHQSHRQSWLCGQIQTGGQSTFIKKETVWKRRMPRGVHCTNGEKLIDQTTILVINQHRQVVDIMAR